MILPPKGWSATILGLRFCFVRFEKELQESGVTEWDAVADQETAKSHRQKRVRRFTQAAPKSLPDERLLRITGGSAPECSIPNPVSA